MRKTHWYSGFERGVVMQQEEQQFLNDLDMKLWVAANKLLLMLDAAM